MDVVLQHHGAKLIYPIPQGLKELCTDISREVLREQPEDICTFIADYTEALLITRENAKVAVRVFYEITQESVLYEAIWKHKGLTIEDVTRAAITIQAAFRGFLDRKMVKQMGRGIDAILRKLGIDRDTATKAAISIQALIRGFYGRRKAKMRKKTLELLAELGITEKVADARAITIQICFASQLFTVSENVCFITINLQLPKAGWRGYLTRQRVKQAGEPLLHKGIVSKREEDYVELSAVTGLLPPHEIRQMARRIVLSMVNKATGYEPSEAEDIADDIVDRILGHTYRAETPQAPQRSQLTGEEADLGEFIKQELQEAIRKALEEKGTD